MALASDLQPHKNTHKLAGADAFTSADLLEALVKRLQESGGPTALTLGEIVDGQFLKRVGATIVSAAAGGGGGGAFEKASVQIWTGDNSNSRDIVLDDDYELVILSARTQEISFIAGCLYEYYYALAISSGYTLVKVMGSADIYFQGKVGNAVRLGTDGDNSNGFNKSGKTYRLIALKLA